MASTVRSLVGLAVVVVIWYVALSYVPQWVGTCLDGSCGLTLREVLVSVGIPLLGLAVPVVLEMAVHRKGLPAALRDLGLSRFSWTGIVLALIYLLPLLAFYPVFAAVTHTQLGLKSGWPWLLLAAVLNNGLAEETMMRGYVFRHIREGRRFWRAAALSTVMFAGYHLPLLATVGPLVGTIGVLVAIPLGLLTAYIYERGDNTVWGPGLLHTGYNALAYVVAFPPGLAPLGSALYLAMGIAVSTLMLLWAYRTSKPPAPKPTFDAAAG